MDGDEAPAQGVPVHLLPEDLAPALSELELVADIWAADAREARHVAERAVALTRFARRRRRERIQEFGPRGGPGLDSRHRQPAFLADFSETLVPEVALLRNCSESEAEHLLVESLILTTTLRGTWTALYEGRISVPKMRALVDLLGTAKPAAVEEIEALVLPVAERCSVPQLRQRVRRALTRLDADALERRRKERELRADVTHQSMGEGMGRVVIDLPVWRSAACVDAVRRLADQQRSGGDTRPIGVIRSDIAADLLLRPWDSSRPPVTAVLTIHAPLAALDPTGDQPPAEVSGDVVTAAQCRDLLERLDMLGVRAAPPGGSVQVAVSDPATGRLLAVGTRSELRRAAGRRRQHRRASNRPADARRRSGRYPSEQAADGPGLPAPEPTTAYRPTAAQRRFVRVRDRHCRWPGCRRGPARCDLDHGEAHADGGPTDCWNLCCLCRRHHRIKTFAPGWGFELFADGSVVVRTPSGVSRMSRPAGSSELGEPDPPWLEELAPPDPMRC
ncbi:HNH endonuclease signature motif containing protein [Blastococcus litoris]|uniref:HNH endonuclease signature motif containing protein n=1 Tax=Blastococcus litoris TaxID=2171622 RepID=UPI000E30A3DD|nr:HNH endonuclease signature motif containing protein [Blastococcus litoris]